MRNRKWASTLPTHKEMLIRLAADLSMEMIQARREWQKIFQVMRTRGLQLRRVYPARPSIKIEGQIVSQRKQV